MYSGAPNTAATPAALFDLIASTDVSHAPHKRQRTQATLEREGALAGQEVQTDVLKMEINALEVELRRARQELGACEAGRREV